jgi:hypothetical protein
MRTDLKRRAQLGRQPPKVAAAAQPIPVSSVGAARDPVALRSHGQQPQRWDHCALALTRELGAMKRLDGAQPGAVALLRFIATDSQAPEALARYCAAQLAEVAASGRSATTMLGELAVATELPQVVRDAARLELERAFASPDFLQRANVALGVARARLQAGDRASVCRGLGELFDVGRPMKLGPRQAGGFLAAPLFKALLEHTRIEVPTAPDFPPPARAAVDAAPVVAWSDVQAYLSTSVDVLGRTMTTQLKDGTCRAVKVRKAGEKNLGHDAAALAWLAGAKLDGYPSADALAGGRLVRVRLDSVPNDVRVAMQAAAERGRFALDETGGFWTITLYRTPSADSFTYLHDPTLTHAQFVSASKKGLGDLLQLLWNQGVVHGALIDAYHDRAAGRAHTFAADLFKPRPGGVGDVENVEAAARFTNLRASGFMDFGELKPLSSWAMEDHQTSVGANAARAVVDYLAGWMLTYIKRLEQTGTLSPSAWQDEALVGQIASTVREVFAFAYAESGGRPEVWRAVEARVDWQRLARQAMFFCGGAYQSYFEKRERLPPSVLPGEMEYTCDPTNVDGWGRIHLDVLSQIGLSAEQLAHVKKTYLRRGVRNFPAPPNVWQVRSDRPLLRIMRDASIPPEKRQDLFALLQTYQRGVRFGGVGYDLGFPSSRQWLVELERALLYTGASAVLDRAGVLSADDFRAP